MAPLRALFVAAYPDTVASTRFRACQFREALAAQDIEADFSFFWNRAELSAFLSPSWLGKGAALLRGASRRLGDVLTARRHDVVVVQREAIPIGPPFLEATVAAAYGRRIVLDIDDALFLPITEVRHAADLSARGRMMMSAGRVRTLARRATEIVVSSRVLENWARGLSDRVTRIPTVVDTTVFAPKAKPQGRLPVVGWVGTRTTIAPLLQLLPILEEVAARRPFELRVVGAGVPPLSSGSLRIVNQAWSIEREPDQYAELDVGLGPLFDDAWSRAKPGFKALVYGACGVPAICSAVGDMELYMKDGETGFLARNPEDWRSALDRLVSSGSVREAMALAARSLAESGPCVRTEGPRLAQVLRRAAGKELP